MLELSREKQSCRLGFAFRNAKRVQLIQSELFIQALEGDHLPFRPHCAVAC
jgi:hypothetical protein